MRSRISRKSFKSLSRVRRMAHRTLAGSKVCCIRVYRNCAWACSLTKSFLPYPGVVLPFLFLRAIQGWCPPVTIFRRKGVRTRREIAAEKYALRHCGETSQTCRLTASPPNLPTWLGERRMPNWQFLIRLARLLDHSHDRSLLVARNTWYEYQISCRHMCNWSYRVL